MTDTINLRLKPLVAALLLASAVAPWAAPSAHAQEVATAAERDYDLPAGPLAASLNRIGREAGLALTVAAGLLEKRQAAPVRGRFAAPEALRRALAGSGLELVRTGAGGYTLRPAPAQPAPAKESLLSPVTVTAATEAGELPPAYAGGQAARGARLGLLGNRDFMATPFNIASYTAQGIEDRQATTLADVVAGDPSVRNAGQAGDVLDSFFIRGFPVGDQNSGEIAFDGVYGVAPNYRVLTDYAERIEVLKGPAALLYGMAPANSVGGTINIVPKRAGASDLTRLTASHAADSQVGAHVDLSRRFGPERRFGLRFNGSHHAGDTALDRQSRTADVGALALDYQGERLRASADIVAQREDIDAPTRRPFLAAGVAVPSAPDGRRNVTQPWEWFNTEDQSVLLRAEYDLSEQLSVFANAGGGRTRVDRLFGNPFIQNAAGDTSTLPQRFRFDVDRSTADVGLRSRFATGPVQHSLTLQASAYRDRLQRGSGNGSAVLSNIYNPVERPEQSVAAPAAVPTVSVKPP